MWRLINFPAFLLQTRLLLVACCCCCKLPVASCLLQLNSGCRQGCEIAVYGCHCHGQLADCKSKRNNEAIRLSLRLRFSFSFRLSVSFSVSGWKTAISISWKLKSQALAVTPETKTKTASLWPYYDIILFEAHKTRIHLAERDRQIERQTNRQTDK